MMEDFIRDNLGDEMADKYRDSDKDVKDEIHINIIAILAKSEQTYPVSMKKEIAIVDGKMKMRYILETDLEHRRKK